MNKVILIGRLTKDPELYNTINGKCYCRFSLAVNRDKENTDFIDCRVWNQTAQNLCQYQKKGSQICVEGSLRVDRYEAQDGTNKTSVYVDAFKIEYLSSVKREEVKEEISGESFIVEANDDDCPF